jgi:hypothetical protein
MSPAYPLTLSFRHDGQWGEGDWRNHIGRPIDEKATEQNVADNRSVFFGHKRHENETISP